LPNLIHIKSVCQPANTLFIGTKRTTR
jgi:hypothetical protein